MTTQKRIDANRRNAAKSTGPRTAEGKARSSRNAIRHGYCSDKFAIPGVDPEHEARRFEEFGRELNPGGDAVTGFLAAMAARASLKLEQCDLVQRATIAKLTREAIARRADERAAEVESASRQLADDPDIASRRLRAIPEGCAFLIEQLVQLRVTLIGDPPHWDGQDSAQFGKLKGLFAPAKDFGPDPLALCTMAIGTYREVQTKLKLNENPENLMWTQKYVNPDDHRRDLEQIDELRQKGRAAQAEIEWLIRCEEVALRERRVELIEAERLDVLETPYRAGFDGSDQGRLIRRYEADLERSFLRTLKEIRERGREAGKRSQRESDEDVSNDARPDAIADRGGDAPARNEARFGEGGEVRMAPTSVHTTDPKGDRGRRKGRSRRK